MVTHAQRRKRPLTQDTPLTDVEELFAHEYLVDRCSSAAYLRVCDRIGRRHPTVKGVRSMSSQIATKPNVKRRIGELAEKALRKVDLTAEWILDRLKREADGKFAKDVVNIDGKVIGSEPDTTSSARVAALVQLGKWKELSMWEADTVNDNRSVNITVVEVVKSYDRDRDNTDT